MGLYALNNPEKEIPRVEGIVENSEVGTRQVYMEDLEYKKRECTRIHLVGFNECFVFDSRVEIEKGARAKLYQHDESRSGSIVYLAGLEILSGNPVLRKAMPSYDFKD